MEEQDSHAYQSSIWSLGSFLTPPKMDSLQSIYTLDLFPLKFNYANTRTQHNTQHVQNDCSNIVGVI